MARPFRVLDATQGRPRLDRYELVAELAAGGMATVYLARIGGAGGFQRFVAIKRLHPHLAHETEFVEMFLDEARLAASIHHPNVVPILEVGETPAGYYLVMEYIEGDTLWNLWNLRNNAPDTRPGQRLPPAVAVRVVHDALLGLHAAHELRDEAGRPLEVVHRDVSPQNILVGIDGTSRLTDFGVARAASRLSSTRSGEIKGKMAYMSPEQVRSGDIDRRSDLFAMGIVLWEALASRHLFLGANEVVTMHRVLNEPIARLTEVVPTLVSPALAAVVARSLERDPDRRFPTCQAMAEAIELAMAGTMPPARDVASAVESLVGPRIAERKEAVSRWLATSQSAATATGTWAALSAGSLPPLPPLALPPLGTGSLSPGLTPGSRPGALPPPTPPPRSVPGTLPPPYGHASLTTGSSLSPLLASAPSSGVGYPPGPVPTASTPRRWLWGLPALLALVVPIAWAAGRSSSLPMAPLAAPPSGTPSAATGATAMAVTTASASAAAAASAPVAVASAEPPPSAPVGKRAAPPPVAATGKTRGPTAPTTAPPGGIEGSPYR